PVADAETPTIPPTARWLLLTASPLIDRKGLTLVGIAVANLENDRPLQLPLPVDPRGDGELALAIAPFAFPCGASPAATGSSISRSTASASATARRRSRAVCSSAATPGSSCRC